MRDLPARQQTLRATIDWSYEILDAGEQRLFECLSVFDGATFEAVEQVTSRIQQLQDLDLDVFEGVSSLSNKSLIRQADEPDGQSRLHMLETIREFMPQHLGGDAEFRAAVQRAHATFFAEFTQAQWVHLTSDRRGRLANTDR